MFLQETRQLAAWLNVEKTKKDLEEQLLTCDTGLEFLLL